MPARRSIPSNPSAPSTAAVTALAFALVLAGCLGALDPSAEQAGGQQAPDADAGADGPNATAALPEVLAVEGCNEHFGVFPVPGPAVTDRLPDGFAHEHMAYVFAFTCDTAALDGEDVEAFSFATAGVFVAPPERHRLDGAIAHAVSVWTVATTESAADAFAAWDLGDVVEGDVVLEVLGEAPPGHGARMTADDGDGVLHMYTGVRDPPTEGEAGTARIFGVADGQLTGYVDINWTSADVYEGGAMAGYEGPDSPLGVPLGPGAAYHWMGDGYGATFRAVALDGG